MERAEAYSRCAMDDLAGTRAAEAAPLPQGVATPSPPGRPGPSRSAGRRRDRIPLPLVLGACAVLLLITMTAGVGIGSVPLSPAAVWQLITSQLAGHLEYTLPSMIAV